MDGGHLVVVDRLVGRVDRREVGQQVSVKIRGDLLDFRSDKNLFI